MDLEARFKDPPDQFKTVDLSRQVYIRKSTLMSERAFNGPPQPSAIRSSVEKIMRCSQSLTCLLAFYAVTLPAGTVSGAPRSVVVTEAQNGQNVQIGINDVLIVRLQAQAGTGYSWAVTTVHHSCDCRKSTPTGLTIPGGPEVQLFTFKPISSGNALLSFAYRRAWETRTAFRANFAIWKVSVSTH